MNNTSIESPDYVPVSRDPVTPRDVIVRTDGQKIIVMGPTFGVELKAGQSFSIKVDENSKVHLCIL